MLPPVWRFGGRRVKEQYVGDVNDYRKYALLRQLGRSGLKLGVCWMLTPDDGSGDGRKLAYLNDKTEARHDPELFALLRRVQDEPDARRLVLIESSGILPGATYENAKVPDPLAQRQLWFKQASLALAPTDLVFVDPDNGLEIKSVVKGRKTSSKFVYLDEVAALYAAGHSILIYQQFNRTPRDALVRDKTAALRQIASDAEIWAVRTSHVVFLLLIQPRHHAALSAAAHAITENANAKFLNAQLIAAAST